MSNARTVPQGNERPLGAMAVGTEVLSTVGGGMVLGRELR